MVNKRIINVNPHFWPENPKANFLQNWAVVSYCKSEGYKTNLDFSLNIPKPKTSPIQSQFKPNFKNGEISLSSFIKRCYEQKTMNYELNKQTQRNPISTVLLGIV